ncbi:uncharacterized protein LOC136030886 isoform X3 [Artemia franciscana]|uniref:uncharacterized protein LOC136030886 isoform X3 n=1 Tax=Artemia franciscana TaxID=6661 RepID=UPI0032DA5211
MAEANNGSMTDIVDVLPSDIKKEVGSSDPVMFPKLEDGLMSTFPSILVPFKLEFDFRESGSISITDQDIVDVLPSEIKKEVDSSDPVMFPKLEDGLMSTFPSISVPFKLESDFQESGAISITDQAVKKSDQKDRLKGEKEKGQEENRNIEGNDDELLCVCQEPHNDRFMICCDCCNGWFHGKCVRVTKVIGEIIETWICPLCRERPTKRLKLLDSWRSRDSSPSNQGVKRKNKQVNSNQGSELEENIPVAAKHHEGTSLTPKDNGRQTGRFGKDILSNEIIKRQALRKYKTLAKNDARPMSKTKRGSKNSEDASSEDSVSELATGRKNHYETSVVSPIPKTGLLLQDDEPCRQLLVTAPQMVNQDKLHTLVNVFTPGLDSFDRKGNKMSPSHHSVMFVVVYSTTSAATYAKKKLHGLDCNIFDCPGYRLIVKFNSDKM